MTALGLLLAVGCGKREPPPSLPQAESRSAQAEEEVPAPTKPTAAFVPAAEPGGCESSYRLVEGTCVHRRYEAADEGALSAAIAQYKQGAAPPMLTPKAVASAPEPSPEQKAGPGSLMRKKAEAEKAASAKERRLAELDAMLDLAREKLAKRDAESKAKQVADRPRTERDEPSKEKKDGEGLEQFARGMNAGGGGAGPAPAAGDSESARLSELSRVTSQLSGDQLKAISEELGKSGFNPGSLDALMKEAQEKPGM